MTAPVSERFWSKVDQSAGLFECWPWTGGLTGSGYGHFWIDGGQRQSTRMAFEERVGPIPAGMELDHLCRNRACVNPAHLEPVAHRENVRRGVSPMARHMASETCSRGHRLVEPNLVHFTNRTRRQCLTCHNWRELRRRRRNGISAERWLGGGRTSRLSHTRTVALA